MSITSKYRVACVGDSITEGFGGIPYPEQLQALLGDRFEVVNFGKFGTHLRMKDCAWSYSLTEEFAKAKEFLPDIVLFMLGTNDRLDEDFPYIDTYFAEDFAAMTKAFSSLPSMPRVFVATSPCCYLEDGTAQRVNSDIRARQIYCAGENRLTVIDMNTCTAGRPDLFPDGLHPDTAGYALIADSFYFYAFGGKLTELTVKTEKDAAVQANNRRTVANEKGIALLSIPSGEQVTVNSNGKTASLTLNGNTTLDLR